MDTLSDIIAFNSANADVALKFGQKLLTESEAVDLDDPATLASYEADATAGIAETRASIDSRSRPTTSTRSSATPPRRHRRRAGYPSVTLPAVTTPPTVARRASPSSHGLHRAGAAGVRVRLEAGRRRVAVARRREPHRVPLHRDQRGHAARRDCPAAPVAPPATSVTLADLVAKPGATGSAPVVRSRSGPVTSPRVGFASASRCPAAAGSAPASTTRARDRAGEPPLGSAAPAGGSATTAAPPSRRARTGIVVRVRR